MAPPTGPPLIRATVGPRAWVLVWIVAALFIALVQRRTSTP
jgi:hypothetical protein